MWLEVNGGLVSRTHDLLDVDATQDCIVGSPYSKGRAVTEELLETRPVLFRKKREKNRESKIGFRDCL